MESLGINLGSLISNLVNFVLLAALLYLLLYKRVLAMMSQRKERIERSMADVDAAHAAAAKAQQEYDRKVAEAQRKAQEIIGQAAQQGEQTRSGIVADAQREAEAIRQKARDEAAQEKTHILAEVQSQIASLSMLATERVLGQAMDEGTQRQLIGQFLAELGPDPARRN